MGLLGRVALGSGWAPGERDRGDAASLLAAEFGEQAPLPLDEVNLNRLR